MNYYGVGDIIKHHSVYSKGLYNFSCLTKPMSGNPDSRTRENFAGGIRMPGIWNRNPTNDWNLESTFHR